MSLVRFFDPFVSSVRPNRVECMLKYGDSTGIGQGTKEFMQAILADIGIQAKVVAWTMQICRSKYYCEYPQGDDWQDQWPLVWKTCIDVAERLSAIPVRNLPYGGSDAFDSTWFYAEHPTDQSIVNCLIISDFNSWAELNKALTSIDEAESHGSLRKLKEKYSAPLPVFSHAEINGRYWQLQVDLGEFPGSFFADGADYGEAVIELCTKMNGTINFLDRV